MKLPNCEKAIISESKLSGYCLNTEHKDGKHKARVWVNEILGGIN